jgi:hypothetical protein
MAMSIYDTNETNSYKVVNPKNTATLMIWMVGATLLLVDPSLAALGTSSDTESPPATEGAAISSATSSIGVVTDS